jgi:tRNA(adenine34) deaminase
MMAPGASPILKATCRMSVASIFRMSGITGAATKQHAGKKWVKDVKTDSTHPPEGLFNKSAATIARELASKDVSPKGPGSGMRMLTYYINRGGKNLSVSRKKELSKAKELLSAKVKAAREEGKE